ncbi:hypothetical protein NP233_g8775 [Leucocoprinus birnbaumii]|uniref:Uncharacterized protein n=1 Tax=Leucocoprinus birnbaumii TaxID=56174 RepID=A0AAD5VQ64_9AGAR|nr:hypothetical protein NP233_g8775 [Leucocoprinus birnbaumii]
MSTDALLHGHYGAASPPPAYGTTNHQHHQHYHHHHHVPHAPVVIHPQYPRTVVVVTGRSRPRCRFCKAFVFAILIWVLIGSVVRHLILLGHRHYPKPHQWAVGPANQSVDYPIPADIDLEACDEPLVDGPGPSLTSFEIDSPSETLLLLSAGSWLAGSVKVTTSSSNSVKFSVSTHLVRRRWGDNTADTIVCRLKRKDGELGVGIFNPIHPRPRYNQVVYEVVLELPEGHPFINRFETNVLNTRQELGDLQDKIFFQDLNLHGSNGAIKATSVSADRAQIRTSNGAIEGHYNASDDFVIATSNARVDVTVDFNIIKKSQAKMTINTSNGPLKADIGLHDGRFSDSFSESFPDFLVSTHTSNSRLDVTFQDSPVNSILTYRGSTSNSPANVYLHWTFEGRFHLNSHSPWFNPIVNEHQVDDPTDKGRTRSVRYSNVRGYVDGEVKWGNEINRKKGEVDVSTSNSRITLDL